MGCSSEVQTRSHAVILLIMTLVGAAYMGRWEYSTSARPRSSRT